MHCLGVSLMGRMSPQEWARFLIDAARAMQMNPCGDPVIREYPVDGKGGVGHTIFQAITTSFMVIDTWPDHDGAYFHISSCKAFDRMALHRLYAMYGVLFSRENVSELEL